MAIRQKQKDGSTVILGGDMTGVPGPKGTRWGTTSVWMYGTSFPNSDVAFPDGLPPRIGDYVVSTHAWGPGAVGIVSGLIDNTHADLVVAGYSLQGPIGPTGPVGPAGPNVSSVFGQSPSSAGFSMGTSVAAGATVTLLSDTFTPPAGAKVALIHVSAGIKSTANCAATERVSIDGTIVKYIRFHNGGAANIPVPGSVSFFFDLLGYSLPTAIPIAVSLATDAGSSAAAVTMMHNYNIDYLM